MSPSRLALAALALVALLVAGGRDARADNPSPRNYPVYVLAIDTDDAEDQADALTAALRSRVRTAPGWSLSETTVTLSMLTAALKCPRTPDPPCLTKISEQLKADRFVWGQMQKMPGNRVKVDLHLWSRNKPETHATEAYADNLKDFTDDRLLRVAQRLFERLSGTVSTGALLVHAGDGTGVVLVDGQRHGTLVNGDASIELPAGPHSVEVRVQGYATSNDSVTIVAGKETRLNVNLVSSEATQPPSQSSGPGTRKVAGWAAIGVGGALLIGAGVAGIVWLNKRSEQNDKLSELPGPTTPDGKVPDPRYPQGVQACWNLIPPDKGLQDIADAACKRDREAKTVSAIGFVLGAAGAVALGVGIYLVVADPGPEKARPTGPKFEDRASRLKPRVRVVPTLSMSTQGLMVLGTF
jgi:hypothetical protein